ncbi:5'-methylthioadenosine/adenosylhomocysteine nucleosidase [Aceticella autotrophica]|uniref:adenosylhomocysteine nucleosidase n=1 Tax=Aceticella autotrophica TaxID=2755338 RepID=A0A975AXJ7_9THEO|nr:5'-methylthioadenosine/adenosylhomocysteine nucleosidase [Aceticella autotrophica]QSZ28203.1 5'-methylthioadenosine/adenosylhomocysteine nucleosidase [Aceticella autotrophica]
MKIGLIGAMDEEVDILKHEMNLKEVLKRAGMDYYTGLLQNTNVVIVRSGIGKVNAAIAAQILISEFNIDYIINTGVAGGLKREVNVGDIVVSTDALEHDFDATAFGCKLGEIPRMDESIFKADKKLIDIALIAAKDNIKGEIFAGRIISGDKFVSSKAEVKRLGEIFDAYAVEMEGAAIAHVAYLNKIPFVIIRSISDNADDNATVDFKTFVEKASITSSNIVKEMLEKFR